MSNNFSNDEVVRLDKSNPICVRCGHSWLKHSLFGDNCPITPFKFGDSIFLEKIEYIVAEEMI